MKKSSRRWKVFVIVLCMLFTMTPGTVFADEPADTPLGVNQPSGDIPTGPGITQGDKPNNYDTVSPPAIPKPETPPPTDTGTPPAITDIVSPPAISDTVSPPAITDTVSPPAFQMLNTVLQSSCNGTIEIEKIIENDPGTNAIFTFDIQKLCGGHWNTVRTVTIAGMAILTVDGLSEGEYKVKEVKMPDYYVTDDDETDRFTISSDVPVHVTFTNTYKTGIITIEKTLIFNVPALLQDTFTFEIYKKTWEDGNPTWDLVDTVSRKGAGIVTCGGLLLGEYKVKEVDLPTHYTIPFELFEKETEVKKPYYTAKVVKFTNQYNAGTITINKVVIGDPESDATFTFDIYKKIKQDGIWTWVFDRAVSRDGAGPLIAAGLANGDYKITERDVKYYDTDQSVELRTIWDLDRHKNVSFTNTYIAPTTGSLKIVKNVSIEGDRTIPETLFGFNVTGPDKYSEKVTVTGGAFVILDDLAPGNYTVTEAYAEDFYPEDNDYEQTKAVEIGKETTIEFTNYYDPEEPTISVTKEVALYNGVIPESGFGKSLTLTELNKQVIYRVSYSYNDAWERSNRYVDLSDSYDRNGSISDITLNLQYWFEGELNSPDGFDPNVAYYYIDTLPTNGTYNNTAYLYEPLYRTFVEEGENDYEQGVIASSSAVVVVNYTPQNNNDDDGDDGDGGSHHYDVTYNANYPTGASISGEVPKDTKDYSYNTTVSVRGNTGDLKAGPYTFIGWNTKADGTGTMYLPGSTFKITADTILYAQWKLISEPAATVADPNTGTDDGSAVSAETTKAAGLDDVPKTGTSNPLLPMFLLGLLSLAGITFGRKKILE